MATRSFTTEDVFTTPGLVRVICTFQPGVHHDMLAFLRIHDVQTEYRDAHHYYNRSSVVDAIMTPWLATFHGPDSRIPLLVTCLPRTSSLLVNYAADHGRVDLLAYVHDHVQTDLYGCSNVLYDLASRHGHLSVVKYLYEIGYNNDRLNEAACQAAFHSHPSILEFFLDTFSDDLDMADWIPEETIYSLVDYSNLTMLQWLVRVWFPTANPDAVLEVVLPRSLTTAVELDKKDIAEWAAAELQARNLNDALLEVFLLHDNTDFLFPYINIDMDVTVADLGNMVTTKDVSETDIIVPHLAVVFEKLTCLTRGPPMGAKRRIALKECLRVSLLQGRLGLLRWLVETQEMDPEDIRTIVTSNDCGRSAWPTSLREYDADMCQFLEHHNVNFNDTFKRRVVSMHLESTTDWLGWYATMRSNTTAETVKTLWDVLVIQFFDELAVAENGSDAAVVGRCLQRMLTRDRPPRVLVLRNVYKCWQSMCVDEEGMAMKREMEGEMLAQAT
ncbi:hypothetical protein As57867_006427, partial [Aphanomyces stellatus]